MKSIVSIGRHPRRNVEDDLIQRRGVVGGGLAAAGGRLASRLLLAGSVEPAREAHVGLELNLPPQPGDELFVVLAPASVAEDRALVLLALGDVEDGYLVFVAATLEVADWKCNESNKKTQAF